MLKQSQKNNKGFTIIEVMIVLAIAGLILLIVFLAVPALQRSSRNTQRKTDIGSIGSAATTVVSNNNGDLTKLTTTTLQNEIGTAKLAYYTTTNITVAAGAATVTNGTTVDTAVVYTGAVCAAMTGGQGATTTGATSKSLAVVYSTENGGTATKNCSDQ